MNKILYEITRYLLEILKKRMVDVSKLVPETDLDRKRRFLEQKVYVNHTTMSMIRADIMRMQNDFIKSTKEPIIEHLKTMTNIEDRNLMIRDFEEQLAIINGKIDDHQLAIDAFDQSIETLNEFKKTNKLI